MRLFKVMQEKKVHWRGGAIYPPSLTPHPTMKNKVNSNLHLYEKLVSSLE